jgi:RimJ/RimL family protein N-acetyltransferase
MARVRLPISTPRLQLRLPDLADVPYFLRYVNDPKVHGSSSYRHDRYTRAKEIAYIRSAHRDAAKGEKLNVAITLRDTGQVIGMAGLVVNDWDNRHAWIGYWLDPPHWHRGYGSEAASALCEVGFRTLRLHRIEARVFSFNQRSMRLLRRLGFRREGRLRSTLYRGGRWHDDIVLGVLRSEFRPFKGAESAPPRKAISGTAPGRTGRRRTPRRASRASR